MPKVKLGHFLRTNTTNEPLGTTDGSLDVSVKGRNVDVATQRTTSSDSVASSGGQVSVIVAPGAGFVDYIQFVRFDVLSPSGSSSGTHRLDLEAEVAGDVWSGIARLEAAHDKPLSMANGIPLNGDVSVFFPVVTDQGAVAPYLRGEATSATRRFRFRYTNNTDANQTNTRTYIYRAIREAVVS